MAQCRTGKCFADFQAFIRDVILAEALRHKVKQVVLIMDTGRTHAPKQLQNWLCEELERQKLSLSVKATCAGQLARPN